MINGEPKISSTGKKTRSLTLKLRRIIRPRRTVPMLVEKSLMNQGDEEIISGEIKLCKSVKGT
jgi:hypothetical protein